MEELMPIQPEITSSKVYELSIETAKLLKDSQDIEFIIN